MYIEDVITDLQNLTQKKITYEQLAPILNKKSGNALRNWSYRKRELKQFEINQLYNAFSFSAPNQELTKQNIQTDDKIELHYWTNLPEQYKNRQIDSVWVDKKIIERVWKLNSDTLCIVPMIGNSMSNYLYPIKNNDILIVDTKQNDISNSGIYFATTQNNTKLWFQEIQLLLNENIEFRTYLSNKEVIQTYSRQQLIDFDFKLIGRVIKNLSINL